MNKGINTSISQNPTPKVNNMLYYIHCIIGITIMFGFGILTPFEPLTVLGMKVLGIFLGSIYLWGFVSTLWPSLLGILALALQGYAPMKTVFAQSFGDPTTLMVLFAMILLGCIQGAGVTKYIARWFLTRKIINGRPVVFSFVFLYAGYFIVFLSGALLAPILLLWSILYSVLDEVGYKKGDKYTTLMVVGVMFACTSGQFGKPFTGGSALILGALEKASHITIPFFSYMLFFLIIASLGIVLYILLIKFLFRPDMSKLYNISTEHFEKDKLPPMNFKQKFLFGILIAFLILMMAPSMMPKQLGITVFLNCLTPQGVVIGIIVLLSILKIDNKPIVNFKEVVGKSVSWDVFALIAMAMIISTALSLDSTGIKPFLEKILSPFLGGHSPSVFSAIILTFSIIASNFANNSVVGVLLIPIISTFGIKIGVNLPALVVCVIFCLKVAILTPAASPFAAVLFGNKEWVDPKDVTKTAVIVVISQLLLIILVGLPIANLMF